MRKVRLLAAAAIAAGVVAPLGAAHAAPPTPHCTVTFVPYLTGPHDIQVYKPVVTCYGGA
jgi:hypothetical protein